MVDPRQRQRKAKPTIQTIPTIRSPAGARSSARRSPTTTMTTSRRDFCGQQGFFVAVLMLFGAAIFGFNVYMTSRVNTAGLSAPITTTTTTPKTTTMRRQANKQRQYPLASDELESAQQQQQQKRLTKTAENVAMSPPKQSEAKSFDMKRDQEKGNGEKDGTKKKIAKDSSAEQQEQIPDEILENEGEEDEEGDEEHENKGEDEEEQPGGDRNSQGAKRQNKQQSPPPPATTAAASETSQKLHLVFSTSCSMKNDWQSYVFFYQALMAKQQGQVTRIVSGCTPEQEVAFRQMHQEQIQIMSDKFHLHFTPEFGRRNSKEWENTKYWNKPFGVRHWLEFKMGFTSASMTSDETLTQHDDDIVILVDPDMLVLEPFVNEFESEPLELWTSYFRDRPNDLLKRVEHGKPIAQDYGFGNAWLAAGQANLTHVVGPDSPVHSISNEDANTFYPAGPPFILTFRDMYRISVHWSDFLPRLFDLFPQFMSEMYGYCLAAAHLGLKHQMGKGFMVSDTEMGYGSEGWYFLDSERVPDPSVICAHPEEPLPYVPHVLHFCQRYAIGESFISKYRTHHFILSCDAPLFALPPSDAAASLNYSHFGDHTIQVFQDRNRHEQHRMAFMTCALMKSLNAAARFYKQNHCNTTANYNMTWNYFQDYPEEIRDRNKKREEEMALAKENVGVAR